jgi:hypothetical protein
MGNLSSGEYPLKAHVRGLKGIRGRFTTANTAAPTKVTPAVNWTVARTGVGTFVVTLPQAYKRILYADANAIVGASSTKFAKIVALSEGGIRSGATITIEVQSAPGTAAETTGLDVMFCVDACQVK